MKLIYMGTPDFAVPALRRLAACAEHEIVGVFTQPDKPQGRKMLLTPPDVKVCAQELGLTPSARSRITAGADLKNAPMDE